MKDDKDDLKLILFSIIALCALVMTFFVISMAVDVWKIRVTVAPQYAP